MSTTAIRGPHIFNRGIGALKVSPMFKPVNPKSFLGPCCLQASFNNDVSVREGGAGTLAEPPWGQLRAPELAGLFSGLSRVHDFMSCFLKFLAPRGGRKVLEAGAEPERVLTAGSRRMLWAAHPALSSKHRA